MSDLNTVLSKLGLTEDEAMILISHGMERYLQEKCTLNVSMDSDVGYDEDYKYARIKCKVSLENESEILLESRSDTVIYFR